MDRFHPQWNKNFQKRPPICIPPSCDLTQKYAGPLDPDADGFDAELYNHGKKNFSGDIGEFEFYDVMRNSSVGGVLIGLISSQHLRHGQYLSDDEKEYFMLPEAMIDGIFKTFFRLYSFF
jgi:hypothetical protein